LSRLRGKNLWIHRIKSGKIAAFLTLNAFAEEIEIYLGCNRPSFFERFITHLRVGQI